MRGKRRNLLIVTLMLLVTTLTGCGKTKEFPVLNYDSRLLESGKQAINERGKVQNRTYSVTLEDGIYIANINGDIQKVVLPEEPANELSISNIEDANSRVKRVVATSMARITAYVNGSEILKNKDQVLQQLGEIEIKIATVDSPALYENGTVYIGREYIDVVCEWMVCHELIHAIADITNDGVENEPYPYYMFNEALTDMITYTLEPDIPDGYISGYAHYYDYIVLYIGCFGGEAISSYFYGYDKLWELVGRDEFDFWVYSLENISNNEVAMVCVNNFLNKWAA